MLNINAKLCNRQFAVHTQRLNWEPLFSDCHHHHQLLMPLQLLPFTDTAWRRAGYRPLATSLNVTGTHKLSSQPACSGASGSSMDTLVYLEQANQAAGGANPFTPYQRKIRHTQFSFHQSIKASLHGYRNNLLINL